MAKCGGFIHAPINNTRFSCLVFLSIATCSKDIVTLVVKIFKKELPQGTLCLLILTFESALSSKRSLSHDLDLKVIPPWRLGGDDAYKKIRLVSELFLYECAKQTKTFLLYRLDMIISQNLLVSISKSHKQINTVKPVLSGLSKIDKTKVLNTFDLHLAIIGLKNQFLIFFLSGRLRQVLLYTIIS